MQQHAKINATVDMCALSEQLACEEESHSEMSASEALLLAARIELEHAHAIELEVLEALEVFLLSEEVAALESQLEPCNGYVTVM